MLKIWITRGLHPIVPNERISAHDSKAGAVDAAVAMVRLILADAPLRGCRPDSVTPETWEAVNERVEDYHGAANASVWITELQVNCRP